MVNNLGERIRRVRGKMTQNDFAKMLNCPQAYISRYENGVVKPSIDFVYNLLSEFNVSLDWLMTGDGEMYATPPPNRKSKFYQDIQEVINMLKGNHKVIGNLKEILQHKRSTAILEIIKDLSPEKSNALISLLRE